MDSYRQPGESTTVSAGAVEDERGGDSIGLDCYQRRDSLSDYMPRIVRDNDADMPM